MLISSFDFSQDFAVASGRNAVSTSWRREEVPACRAHSWRGVREPRATSLSAPFSFRVASFSSGGMALSHFRIPLPSHQKELLFPRSSNGSSRAVWACLDSHVHPCGWREMQMEGAGAGSATLKPNGLGISEGKSGRCFQEENMASGHQRKDLSMLYMCVYTYSTNKCYI